MMRVNEWREKSIQIILLMKTMSEKVRERENEQTCVRLLNKQKQKHCFVQKITWSLKLNFFLPTYVRK